MLIIRPEFSKILHFKGKIMTQDIKPENIDNAWLIIKQISYSAFIKASLSKVTRKM